MVDVHEADIRIKRLHNEELELPLKAELQGTGLRQWTASAGEKVKVKLSLEPVSGGIEARLQLGLKSHPFEQSNLLALEQPVTLELNVLEQPEKITALYLFSDWWSRPAFVDNFGNMPKRTQVALLKYRNHYACLVPAVGKHFKATLEPGAADRITLKMEAGIGGQDSFDEPVFVWTEAATIYHAVQKAFQHLAAERNVRLRDKRQLPEMFHYLGWCSWDAFYRDVTEEKLREKIAEFKEKRVPVRWMIIDDGWLSVTDDMLTDLKPDSEKFPNGFAEMIRDIKRDSSIDWVGVWHALGGYWGGIKPDSPVESAEKDHLIRTVGGKVLPSPNAAEGFGFYSDWYTYLTGEGVDFVKVDVQGAVRNQYENSASLGEAARGLLTALEGAASKMDGAIINCMGMTMENVLSRQSSAISRNSDDFFPRREGSFNEHLLENAYNDLYHGQLYYCDWDMFWTEHPAAEKHALLRAISGGPVYVSDRISATDPEILAKLTYKDGRLLMMDRPALPTEDCVFEDPEKHEVLKLSNVAPYGDSLGGIVAVFNISNEMRGYSVRPTNIPEFKKSGEYVLWNPLRQELGLHQADEAADGFLNADGHDWFVILPYENDFALLGLTGKYAGFSAVERLYTHDNVATAVMKESGPFAFVSMRTPVKVFSDGEDVTAKMRVDGNTFRVDVPEKSGKVVIEVRFPQTLSG